MAAGVYQSVFVLLVVCVGAARGKIVDLSVDRSARLLFMDLLSVFASTYCCYGTCKLVPLPFREREGLRLVAGRGPVQHSLHWHKSTAEPLLKLGLS